MNKIKYSYACAPIDYTIQFCRTCNENNRMKNRPFREETPFFLLEETWATRRHTDTYIYKNKRITMLMCFCG